MKRMVPSQPSDLPLETPSHNGPYRGTLQVRTIPHDASGSHEFHPILWGNKSQNGHVVQSKLANQRKLSGAQLREKLKNFCVHGHEYTEENTARDTRGSRKCRTCARARQIAANTRRKRLDVPRPRR